MMRWLWRELRDDDLKARVRELEARALELSQQVHDAERLANAAHARLEKLSNGMMQAGQSMTQWGRL